MSKTKEPKITWGTSFANTINIGYRLDNWSSYSKSRDGSEWVQSESGLEDAWIVDTDYYLEADIRWIPTANITSPVTQTGWDGTTGWRAFLEWTRAKNLFRFFPDKDSGTYIESYLVNGQDITPSLEPDSTRRIRLILRNPTTAYDGY